MMTTTRLVAPHFSGVHRGEAPTGDDSKLNFCWNGQQYHTSGQDTVVLRSKRRADLDVGKLRVFDDILGLPTLTPASSSAEEFKKTLAEQEPNNRLQSALKHQNPSDVLELLKNPEVKVSDSDTPGLANLPERLLENADNFNHISKTLGGDNKAVSFIEKTLTKMFKKDLDEGIGSGNWKESKDQNHDTSKTAQELAKDTIEEYLGSQNK